MSSFKPLWYDWMGANEYLFLEINHIREPVYDKIMKAISWAGQHELFPYYMLGLFAFYILAMAKKIIMGQRGKWYYTTSWIGIWLVLTVSYAITGVITREIKDQFSYPRPYIMLATNEQVYKLEDTEPAKDMQSFPSGHVTFVTLLVMGLMPLLSKRMFKVGIAWVFLTAWSRISLGMHFPADVLGAIFITIPVVFFVRAIIYYLLRNIVHIKC